MRKQRRSDRYLSEKRKLKAELRRQRLTRGPREERLHSIFWRNGIYLRRLAACAASIPHEATVTVKVPKTFSLIREPEKALQVIGELIRAAQAQYVTRIHIDHSHLTQFDLASEAILDLIAVDVQDRRFRTGIGVQYSGRFPSDANARRFVQAIGISKFLKISNVRLPANELQKLKLFEQGRKTPRENAEIKVTSEKALVVQKFADHIGECMSVAGMALSLEDRQALCEYTGELIDNVEQHGRSADWYISSYLDTSILPPTCEVAIYNFGQTIAGSFLALPDGHFALKLVQPYVDMHQRRRLFSESWRPQDLLTVIALQGGISCKRASEDDTRGQGTVDLIEFFERVSDGGQPVGGVRAEMAILSGDTHIRFDGTHRMGADSTGRQIIAFNKENSLSRVPDSAYVRPLKDAYFPGTVVSIRFALGK